MTITKTRYINCFHHDGRADSLRRMSALVVMFFLCLVICPFTASAQEFVLTGRVMDEQGNPVELCTVSCLKQGKVTTGLLNTMGINFDVLSKEEDKVEKQIAKAITALQRKEVYALVIEKDTFEDYKLQNIEQNSLTLSREEAVQSVASVLGETDCIVSTTGMISRELFEYRAAMNQGHERDFLTVGSMGHASQIALGISLCKPERRVFCFDGDGASLMHLGSWAITGANAASNFYHIVFNNSAHDSVGGQPTVGSAVDFPAIAKACGYQTALSVHS